jgi:hypothetical protein
MNMRDYCRYYDRETYLFEDVSSRFQKQGFLDAFDFFSIVIWKANRAKSIIARKLLRLAEPHECLDDVSRRLTAAIHAAGSDEERFALLFKKPWAFALPMASAVLTVLYPNVFTVYDYRVCDELKDFHSLKHLSDNRKVWQGYLCFCAAVDASSPGSSLRNKDRALIGRSLASQLEEDIRSGFRPVPKSIV